ncbi:hypothetical protein niasHS_016175 [Heterodera schachtii]|uniref:Serpin domain-containing protein n=1 Tax=Heterodera schachtii TaxID=97005 RepID=A0ABD2HWG1_HETSC
MSSPPSPNVPLILEAQADFALNLLREVSTDDRSCIVSPFSVAVTLSMVYAGAKEKTGEEMGQLLAKGAPESEVHKYFGALLKSTTRGTNKGSSNTLEMANKVYVKKGIRVKDAFKGQIEGNYGGQLETMDFEDGAGTAEKINKFVKEATHQKILDVVKPDNFDENTRLVLINALYFNGTWAKPFDPNWTIKLPFYVDADNTKKLDMMRMKAYFIYFEDTQLQLLGMPYQSGKEFMFVLLPRERFGLAQLLAELDGKKLMKLIKVIGRDPQNACKVQVVLPKFKLEAIHELNKPLTNMGMTTAFTDRANFEGISNGPLKISEVVQKAFIEVNEEGTVAAAATKQRLVESASAPTSKECTFVADHPFCAFLTRDDTVLFSAIFRD